MSDQRSHTIHHGAPAIRIAFATFLRTAAVSAGIALAAPLSLTAAAQGPSPAIDEVDPAQPIADEVVDLAAWVIAANDNRGLPFAVVDKEAAQVLIFGPNGKLRGLAPALIGSPSATTAPPASATANSKTFR